MFSTGSVLHQSQRSHESNYSDSKIKFIQKKKSFDSKNYSVRGHNKWMKREASSASFCAENAVR